MYEDLIKRLRSECALPYSTLKDMREAADVIEELSTYVRQIDELRKDGYYLLKTVTTTDSQATMTGALPKPPKEK